MSIPRTGDEGQKAPGVSRGQAAACPKCHAPLQASGFRPHSGWLAPLWLRLLVLVLILAALAAPLVATYHRRSRVLGEATTAARDYLNRLRAEDAKEAMQMMTETASQQVTWRALRSILELDGVTYHITDAGRDGELVDVGVTCVLPQTAQLPTLPLVVDKNPRAILVLERDKDGQWNVSSVSLLPKAGTHALPKFVPTEPVKPAMGAAPRNGDGPNGK